MISIGIEKVYLKYSQLPFQLESKRMVPAKKGSGEKKGHSVLNWSDNPRTHHQHSQEIPLSTPRVCQKGDGGSVCTHIDTMPNKKPWAKKIKMFH